VSADRCAAARPERIVRVIAEARGQRAMIESPDTTGRTCVGTVTWNRLREPGAQLFWFGTSWVSRATGRQLVASI
jgi:hypothetical protein